MKKKMAACLLAGLMLLCTAALADGGSGWLNSATRGSLQLASYAGDYNGYVDVDGCGGSQADDSLWVTVISKKATVWSSPSTGSKQLGGEPFGDGLHVATNDSGQPIMEKNFYKVDYNGKTGWINASYVVRNKLEIVLMESNVPAYVAPDRNAKKVGSLSKMTRYRVIGFYDDYYIVSFRGAACAYIPKDAAHYDTKFIGLYRQAAVHSGSVEYGTKLRTGPDDSYPEIKTMNAGASVECLDEIDGWYMIRYSGKGADGEVFAFIDSDAVSVNW